MAQARRRPQPSFLWVTGLARAGTTSVLERLVATRAFHSLNYANMPLVLARDVEAFPQPRHWRTERTQPRGRHPRGSGFRRGAGRGVLPSHHWTWIREGRRTSCARHRRRAARDLPRLPRHCPGLRGAPSAMYIAKNNALLRYPAMRRLNREFHAVVVFQEPLSHAASLLAMHRKYCAMQADDPFVLEYMDWLAHHEFGLGQKPFHFPSTQKMPAGPHHLGPLASTLDQPLQRGSHLGRPSPAPGVVRAYAHNDVLQHITEVAGRSMGGFESTRTPRSEPWKEKRQRTLSVRRKRSTMRWWLGVSPERTRRTTLAVSRNTTSTPSRCRALHPPVDSTTAGCRVDRFPQN